MKNNRHTNQYENVWFENETYLYLDFVTSLKPKALKINYDCQKKRVLFLLVPNLVFFIFFSLKKKTQKSAKFEKDSISFWF